MDPFSLRCFVTVARLGSFSRAADELFRTQPAISLQVRKLEEELRQPLFDRSRRAPRLTEAGRILFAEARGLLEQLDGLPDRLAASTGEPTGTLVIASNASLISHFLPRTVSAFQRTFPRVALRLLNLTARGIVRAVGEGEADLGVGFLLGEHPEIECRALARSPFVLVAPRGGPPQGARPSLARVLAGPLVHFEEGIDLRRHLEHVLAGGRSLAPVLELPTIESILQYVGCGIGCSILPAFAVVEHWRETVAVRGLGRSIAPLQISACLHRRRPPSRAAAAFLERLRPQALATPASAA